MSVCFEQRCCPLEGCDAPLHMIISGSLPVYEDLTDSEIGVFDNVVTSTWHVECENGHTVMVPGGAEDYAPFPTADQLARLVAIIEPTYEDDDLEPVSDG